METSTQDVRASLIKSVEHCYYNGSTAGQMWLHDLSAYLQELPAGDPRLKRLGTRGTTDAEEYLCGAPHPLAQAFDPGVWLDQYAELAAQR
jgi:hypothetical protein